MIKRIQEMHRGIQDMKMDYRYKHQEWKKKTTHQQSGREHGLQPETVRNGK